MEKMASEPDFVGVWHVKVGGTAHLKQMPCYQLLFSSYSFSSLSSLPFLSFLLPAAFLR